MDVSKKYQKMCDCSEIRGESVTPPYPTDYYAQRKRGATRYGYQLITADIVDDDYIWLPTQDQTQEMMPEKNCKCPCCLIFHLNKFVEDNIDGFADEGIDSMEQYWLAFYMWENHQKIWDGKKWVKSGKE